MPADPTEPEASATLTLGEYIIKVTEGELIAGPQVLKIENVGAQPHFVFDALGPEDMTEERVGVALDEELAAGDSGTPPAYSDFNPDEELTFEGGFFSGNAVHGHHGLAARQSRSRQVPDGRPFPDLGDGLPHAYHGMYTVVEVAT